MVETRNFGTERSNPKALPFVCSFLQKDGSNGWWWNSLELLDCRLLCFAPGLVDWWMTVIGPWMFRRCDLCLIKGAAVSLIKEIGTSCTSTCRSTRSQNTKLRMKPNAVNLGNVSFVGYWHARVKRCIQRCAQWNCTRTHLGSSYTCRHQHYDYPVF